MFPGNREIWRSIDGYDNYEVSTHGRVRNAATARILKPFIQSSGYLQVSLYKDKKERKFYIHRLVAQEFIDNPDDKQFADHIDNDRTNNSVNNLRWASGKENQGNRLKQQNTSSKYKGVYFNKQCKKWKVQIKIDDKRKHLGYFENEKDAARAYNEAAKHNFCEYALLNEISDDDDDEEDDEEDDSENESVK
jgi:hypothetical protein